jgi:hypothetical protein
MVTKSYSQRTADSESPALAMSWISEGGRLRSRWTLASQPRHVKSTWLDCAPNLNATTQRAAMLKVQSLYVLGVLCCFIALLL